MSRQFMRGWFFFLLNWLLTLAQELEALARPPIILRIFILIGFGIRCRYATLVRGHGSFERLEGGWIDTTQFSHPRPRNLLFR